MKKKSAFISVFLFSAMLATRFEMPVLTNSEVNEAIYSNIAEYYDNRRAVVTLTADDWNEYNNEYFEDMCSILTEKHIFHTVAIVTDHPIYGRPNWTRIQYWLDQGYTEAASHSRTHPHLSSHRDYDSEIGGSKDDITGNLTLPSIFSLNGTEYVYTWIEPYGDSNNIIRKKLGYYGYLMDRMYNVSSDNGWATWDLTNNLFNRMGYSIKMGSDGTEDTATLNDKFMTVYNAGGIYHIMCHASRVNWQPGQYADFHTNYISGRLDVWYVDIGLLYLYRWIGTQDIVNVTSSGSGLDKAFKISISSVDRQKYGARYPITYVFDIPSDWTCGRVCYRYQESDQWMIMENKRTTDFFNGVNASRFDFVSHKAYVSVGFGDVGNDIYLLIIGDVGDNVPPKADFTIVSPPKPHQPTPDDIIQFKDKSFDPDGSIVSWHWEFGDGTTSTDQNPTHKYEALGTYIVTLVVTDDDGAIHTESKIHDSLPPVTLSDYNGLWHIEDFTITLTAEDDYGGVQAIYYRINGGPIENMQVGGQLNIITEGNNKLEYWSVDGVGNEETHNLIDVMLDKTAPVANAGDYRSVTQNILVTFDASKSSDNIGVISHEWDFGDGSKGTGLITTHNYTEEGTYIVSLTVKDAAGNKNTTSVSIIVLKDTDRDGTPDSTDTDDDGDGMPDTWELSYGLDPLDATDAALDLDGDGVSNLEEYQARTDPTFYFSPFPWWILVLVAVFGTIFIIIRYVKAPSVK